MYENQDVPVDQQLRFLGAVKQMVDNATPAHREAIEAGLRITNQFLHDEQKRLTYGSPFVMVGGSKIPTYGIVVTRDQIKERAELVGFPVDRIISVLEHKIDMHLLPSAAYSHVVPIGIPAEVPAIYAWPLAEEVWEEVALRQYDYDQFPQWVQVHVNLAATALVAHRQRVTPLIDAAAGRES